MQAGAVANFLQKACTGSVNPPAFEVGEDGPYFRDGVLYLRTQDGWNTIARLLVIALFHAVSRGEVDPDSPDLAAALAVTNQYVQVKCPNENCGRTLGLPSSCPQCFVGIQTI